MLLYRKRTPFPVPLCYEYFPAAELLSRSWSCVTTLWPLVSLYVIVRQSDPLKPVDRDVQSVTARSPPVFTTDLGHVYPEPGNWTALRFLGT